jgi:CRISPR-associated protein Cmr3
MNGERIIDSVLLDDYVTSESKIGIYRGRDTNYVKKSMLYRSPLMRLEGEKRNSSEFYNTAIAANIDGAGIGGLIRFGGENKVANFTAYEGALSPKGVISDNGRFKIYLASPSIFRSGYLPELPVKATLLAAAINGYDSIGGFSIKEKHPKVMRRAVKAGSVYYYELDEKTTDNYSAIQALHGSSISEYSSRKDGFGICYIGKI